MDEPFSIEQHGGPMRVIDADVERSAGGVERLIGVELVVLSGNDLQGCSERRRPMVLIVAKA